MITLYHPGATDDPEATRSRRCPPESFLNTIEAKRYEYLAEVLRELDRPVLAQMCVNWAKEHRLTVGKLAEADRRLADLDARLRRIGGAE